MTITVKPIFAKVPDITPILDEVRKEMRAEGADTNQMFASFFQTWASQPTNKFKIDEPALGRIELLNYVDGDQGLMQIVKWVIFGTKGHYIAARGGHPLHYQVFFTPKTQPGVIMSGPGEAKHGPWTHPWVVYNPGIHPRGTLAQIQQEREQRVRLRLMAATRRGIKKAWSGPKVQP